MKHEVITGGIWRRSHYLDRMTLKELWVAYFQYPAIIAYLLLTAVSVGVWLVATAIAPAALHPEMMWAMLAPLASALVTWVTVAVRHRTARERVTGVLMAGFGAKMLFFGAYLAVMLRVVGLRPVPFAAAFVGYVVLLYVMEALFFRRLFSK